MEKRKIRKSDLIDFDFACVGKQIADDFAKVAYFAEKLQDKHFWENYQARTLADLEFMAEALNTINDFSARLISAEHYNILNEE